MTLSLSSPAGGHLAPQNRERTLTCAVLIALPLLGIAVTLLSFLVILPFLILGFVAWFLWSIPQTGIKRLILTCNWWQLLWLLTMASGLVFRARTVSDAQSDALDSAALFRVGMMGLVVLLLQFAIIGRKIDVLSPMFRGIFLIMMAFNVLNLLSVVWSVNPGWTLYRSFEYTIDVLLIITISSTFKGIADYKRLFDWTWLLTAGLLSTIAIGVVLAPDLALPRMGVLGYSIEGIYPMISRNSVGGLAALIAIVAVARLATGSGQRHVYWGVLLLCLAIVVLAQTRSAIAPLGLAIPVVLIASRKVGISLAVPALVLGVLLMSNLGGVFNSYWQRGETSGQLTNLSGRLGFWAYAWELAAEKPATGYGGYAGGRFMVASAVGHETLSSTHGTYTEILVDVGFPGLFLLIAMVLAVWFYVGPRAMFGKRQTPEDRATWALSVEALGVITMLTCHSIFDVDIVWHPSLGFLALAAFAEHLRRTAVRAPKKQREERLRFDPALLPAHAD